MDVIVSLTPAAGPDPYQALGQPPDGATVVEVRADLFPGLDLRRAVRECPLPVLVTVRSTAEGGAGPTDPVARRSLLTAAREAGAALVDLEADRDAPLLAELGLEPERVVLSWHDPAETPADLGDRAAALLAAPVRWVKLVPTAHRLADLEPVLALHQRFNRGKRDQRRLVTFAMDTVGVPTRFLAPLLGPSLAFAAWSSCSAAAPGQPTVKRLTEVCGHLAGPPQRLLGVVGSDTSRSLSPAMHAAGYRALGLPYLLLPFSVPEERELAELFVPRGQGLLARVGLDAWGFAVTSPYKAAAAAAADLRAPRVRLSGAANTLLVRDRRLVAENTDADGVVSGLKGAGVDPAGQVVLVQGTGGAARGATVGLYLAGAQVFLRSRDPERARRVAAELRVTSCAPDQLPTGTAILVNATPLGSKTDDDSPFSPGELRGAAAVVDLTYAEQPSALALLAAELGLTVVDGREVLACQGFAQFAAFTGVLPPKDAMRAALRS